jgi:hypothetical protein
MNLSELILQLINEGGAIVLAESIPGDDVFYAQSVGRFARNHDGTAFVRITAKELERMQGSLKTSYLYS